MLVYFLNIVLILIWAITFYNRKNGKKIFCTLVTLQWILISGLRNISVGADTYAYKVYRFDKTLNSTWTDLYENFFNIVFRDGKGKDPLYPIIEKTFQIFSDNYQIFLVFIAIFFTGLMGRFIFKYSNVPSISFLVYSCLFYSFFAITGHRQTLATALAVFIGYEFLKRKKIISYIVIILIASLIHKSALCLIPFYWISNKKITHKYIIIVGIIFIGIFIFKNNIMYLLSLISGYDSYSFQVEGAGAHTFTLLFITIGTIAVIKRKSIIKNSEDNIMYNAIFMGILFLPFTYVDPNMMRIVQYFSIYIMILIPKILVSFSKKEIPVFYYLGSCLMILLMLKTQTGYSFFWQ